MSAPDAGTPGSDHRDPTVAVPVRLLQDRHVPDFAVRVYALLAAAGAPMTAAALATQTNRRGPAEVWAAVAALHTGGWIRQIQTAGSAEYQVVER